MNNLFDTTIQTFLSHYAFASPAFNHAVRAGEIRLEGPRDLVRAFPGWLLLSHFAGVQRPRPARAS